MNKVPLKTIPEGSKFRCPWNNASGTVKHQGTGSTTVRISELTGGGVVQIKNVQWSPGTLVEEVEK